MITWARVSAFASIAVAVFLLGSAYAQTPPAATRDVVLDLQAKAEARIRAAAELLGRLQERQDGGELLTPEFLEAKMLAQRWLAQARIDATSDVAAQIRAAEQYVQQARRACDVLQGLVGQRVNAFGVAFGTYGVADAEFVLARLKAGHRTANGRVDQRPAPPK